MRSFVVAALLLSATIARADGVAEEVDAGSAPATASSPASHWLADKVTALWDASERWQVRVDASTTRLYGGATTTSHDDVVLAAASLVYAPNEHWTLRVGGSWSPESATHAVATIDASGAFADGATAASAQLLATSSALGATAGVDYDSASSGTHSLSVSITATATYFNTDEEIVSVADDTGAMLDPHGLRVACLHQTCSDALSGLLWPQWVQLGQFALGASATDTIAGSTDVSVDATYFAYDSDPMRLGFFALATAGRSNLGSAAGVAPMQGAIAPSVSHRFGNLAVTAAASYSDYVDGQGTDVGGSARVQYKLVLGDTQRLKLFAKAAVARHIDAMGTVTQTGSAGAGMQYSW